MKACSRTGARILEQGPSTLGAPRGSTDMGPIGEPPFARNKSVHDESCNWQLCTPFQCSHEGEVSSSAERDSTVFPCFLLPHATQHTKPPMRSPPHQIRASIERPVTTGRINDAMLGPTLI